MSRYLDVACDLLIIEEWQSQQAWPKASAVQRAAILANSIAGELVGYCVPDDYSASRRVHVFGADDCETWLGCFDPAWCNSVGMPPDADMTVAVAADGGPFALLLDGCAVVGVYSLDQK